MNVIVQFVGRSEHFLHMRSPTFKVNSWIHFGTVSRPSAALTGNMAFDGHFRARARIFPDEAERTQFNSGWEGPRITAARFPGKRVGRLEVLNLSCGSGAPHDRT
jgi:hypothetical protein